MYNLFESLFKNRHMQIQLSIKNYYDPIFKTHNIVFRENFAIVIW